MFRGIVGTLVALVLIPAVSWAGTPDTAFTYQGELRENGDLASGPFGMEFSLWDSLAGGGQHGGAIAIANVPVTDGRFTVELDFGAEAFDNSARWLQVVVEGTALSPRQPITRAPYALQTRGIFVDEDHNVGIGTTQPVFPLHVQMTKPAAAKANIAIWAENLLPTGFGYGVFATTEASSGRAFFGIANSSTGETYAVRGHTESPDGYGAYFTGHGQSVNYFQRHVGIGIDPPLYPLHVVATSGVSDSTIYTTNDTTSGTTIFAQSDGGSGRAIHGLATSSDGDGILGEATSLTGPSTGVAATADSTSGTALFALATALTGETHAVRALCNSSDGYAAYFHGGRNYMQGFLGLNKLEPEVRLDVVGSIQYTGTITDVSDIRLKENIEPLVDALDKIQQIDGVYFNMIESPGEREVGLIAQNVQEVLPEAVRIVDSKAGHLGVSYPSLVPLLVEAVKSLHEDNELLRAENDSMRARLEALERRFARLESRGKE
jgi:hypothetical protein